MLSLAVRSFSWNPLGLLPSVYRCLAQQRVAGQRSFLGAPAVPSARALVKHHEPIRDCTQSLLAAELTSSAGIGGGVRPTLGNSPHALAEKCWNKIYSSNSRVVGKEEAKFSCLLCEWIYSFKFEFLMQISLKFQFFEHFYLFLYKTGYILPTVQG